jgi:hypothetical protein
MVAGAEDSRGVSSPGVLLLFLPGPPPLLTLFTLALALYLTVWELREHRPNYLWWIWWLLLVFCTHFVGYLVLRAYGVYRRWHGSRA